MSETTQALFGRDDADPSPEMTASDDAWGTPIVDTVMKLMDDFDIYIIGFDPTERYALIRDNENMVVSVASVATCNGLGRWECSVAHYLGHTDMYHERYPKH